MFFGFYLYQALLRSLLQKVLCNSINFYNYQFLQQVCNADLYTCPYQDEENNVQIANCYTAFGGGSEKKQHKLLTAASALSGLLFLNLPLSSAALKSPLKQLLKIHWFHDVCADKTFHDQTIKVKKKKVPNIESAQWRQLAMIPSWLLLKDHYLQAPYPRGTFLGKSHRRKPS